MSSNDNDDGYNDDDDYDGDDDYDYYNESGDDIGDGTGKHRSVGFAGQIKKQPRKNTNRKTTEKRKNKDLRQRTTPLLTPSVVWAYSTIVILYQFCHDDESVTQIDIKVIIS